MLWVVLGGNSCLIGLVEGEDDPAKLFPEFEARFASLLRDAEKAQEESLENSQDDEIDAILDRRHKQYRIQREITGHASTKVLSLHELFFQYLVKTGYRPVPHQVTKAYRLEPA
jgi:hypothetical protein